MASGVAIVLGLKVVGHNPEYARGQQTVNRVLNLEGRERGGT